MLDEVQGEAPPRSFLGEGHPVLRPNIFEVLDWTYSIQELDPLNKRFEKNIIYDAISTQIELSG